MCILPASSSCCEYTFSPLTESLTLEKGFRPFLAVKRIKKYSFNDSQLFTIFSLFFSFYAKVGKYYNSTESHKLVFSTLLTCNFRITSLRKVATNGPQKFLRYASALDCLVCPVHFGGLADAKLQKCLSGRQHLNERTIEKERMND